jgi:cyclopropane-fatty-acyl-phospholipid synthase
MDTLIQKLELRLRDLPVPVVLHLPTGHQVGPAEAAVHLSFSKWSSLAAMAAGQTGGMAEDFVESRLRSAAAHSYDRDAAKIQFHCDVSDDFYALWLDPRRV